MRKLFLSFSTRLTFYILSLTFLIFLCIAVVFNRYGKVHEEKQAFQYTAALQKNFIHAIDAELLEVEHSMRLTVEYLADIIDQPDSVMPLMVRELKANHILKGVGVAFQPNFYPSKGPMFFEYASKEGPENKIVCSHIPMDYGGDYTQRKWFNRVMNTHESYWTDPYVDYNTQTDCMTSFVIPCTDKNGKPYAVLLADVELNNLTDEIQTLRPYADSYSFILTHNGQYVTHPDHNLILKSDIHTRAEKLKNSELELVGRKMTASESGTMKATIEGRKVLLCYAPMERAGWSVCSVTPYRTVMHNLYHTSFITILILIIGLLLLSLCIRWLVRYLSHPIVEFADISYSIAKGNFDIPLPEVNTKDDLRKLHDAFAYMQQSLAQYTHELEQTARAKERIASELSIARKIQMGLVPTVFSPFAECKALDLFASLTPAKEVGGDFYDFLIRDGKLKFVIGDVSGKGVPASLVMAITRTLFRIVSLDECSPAETVSKLNKAISDKNDTNMFVTFLAGELNLTNGNLTFCNAGHNAPLIIHRDGRTEFLQMESNLPLGVWGDYNFADETTTLPKGSAMLLYTDGLTEAENKVAEQFGEDRTISAAQSLSQASAQDIITGITQCLAEFVGDATQSDDLTLMCFRLNPTEAEQSHEKKLVIHNKLEESTQLVPFLSEVGAELQLDKTLISSLNLAIEEALVNVINYAYPQDTTEEITLTAQWTADKKHIDFILRDHGTAFNPLQKEEADITLGVEERPIGGLGIFLVKELMDEVTYQRTDGENILVMGKNV